MTAQTVEKGAVKKQERGGMAYLQHFIFASLGNGPLPFHLSLCLMFHASNLLRAEDASWLSHALQVTPASRTANALR